MKHGLMKRFARSALTMVLASTLLLTGCGSSEKPAADEGDGKLSGTISYAFWDAAQVPYFEACVKEFNKLYPDITVKLEQSPWDEYWTKLEASATGGSSADVFWLNGPNINKYAKGGVLLPIDDRIEASGIDTAKYPEALVDLYNVDGVQYALPKDYDTIAVFYNKELFEQAGVALPTNDWTWEDMVETATKLTKQDGSVYGIAAPLETQTGYYNTVFAHGGCIISEDGKKSGYDLPETQAGIQCWVDLQKAEITPSLASLTETEGYIQFLSGRTAMLVQGSWFLNRILEDENPGKFGVVALPSINGKKASVIHGLGNCISKSTKNPEAAWKWVEFLSSEKANVMSAEMGAAIPAYGDTAQLWVEKHPEYDLHVFMEAAQEYSYPFPASLNTAEWNQYELDNLKHAYNLEIEVKEACDKIADAMNKVLAEEG